MMLEKYALEQGFTIYDYYIDDGYSGLNFERPAFKKMMQDISDGKINLVLTKDLSRLGRNHIQTSYFIEIFFPDNNIRYIAVKASWINKLGYFVAGIDGIITVYDNLQQGNSLEQAVLDGVMSFGVSAASSWVGGFVGANVGGAIGSLIGSFIPIPVVGTAIGFITGTIIGVGVSWFVDNLLEYVKDEFLEWLFRR